MAVSTVTRRKHFLRSCTKCADISYEDQFTLSVR
jgi:hypothetical protein